MLMRNMSKLYFLKKYKMTDFWMEFGLFDPDSDTKCESANFTYLSLTLSFTSSKDHGN